MSERPFVLILFLEASTVHAHNKVELRIKTPNYELVAHHEGPEMYQEIDRVTDKMIMKFDEQKKSMSMKPRKQIHSDKN